ncbi:MAG TPA: ATP-binding protein [bacterium]|nr:ATP-binding protein [bacterium]
MNSRELERILEGGVETQHVDFKAPIEWNVLTFVRHILALSNVQDGGFLIVGVEQDARGHFVRKGVTPDQSASYVLDEMRDQISPFADPHVSFRVDCVKDAGGLEYVVIEVLPFDEVPVICCKESAKTHVGSIYYRTRDRRVESAPISNSNDMRDVVERAAIRSWHRLQGLGLAVEPSAKKMLDDELEGL